MSSVIMYHNYTKQTHHTTSGRHGT